VLYFFRFLKSAGEIEEGFPDFVVIRLYRASCADMKARLSTKAGDIRGLLLRTVAAEASERSKATKGRFDAIIAKLREEPQVIIDYWDGKILCNRDRKRLEVYPIIIIILKFAECGRAQGASDIFFRTEGRNRRAPGKFIHSPNK
jgi:hypothetical protein